MNDSLLLKYPIVLVHGLGARSNYGPFEYFHGLPARLRKAGNVVFVPNLTSWQTIETRSEQLKKQIEERFPDGEMLNLVGHSMGGLDARYITSKLGMAERIASVTTIGTPNGGSSMGDLAVGLLSEKMFEKADLLLKLMECSTGGFKQITREYCQNVLSKECPNMPKVAYFSAMTAIRNPITKTSLPVFWIPTQILQKYEGDNDGFVSVESSKNGEHIVTEYGDHYAQIGQFLGRARGLDYVKFQDQIFERLRHEGF